MLKITQMYYLIVPRVRTLAGVSLGSNQGAAGLSCFLEAPGENLFPCIVQLLEAAYTPWLVAPFLDIQSQQLVSCDPDVLHIYFSDQS